MIVIKKPKDTDDLVQPIFVELNSGKIIMFIGPALTEEEKEDILDIKIVLPVHQKDLLDLMQDFSNTRTTH